MSTRLREVTREKKETLFGKISKNSIAPQRHRNHLWFHTIDTLCIRKKNKVLEFQISRFCLCKKVNIIFHRNDLFLRLSFGKYVTLFRQTRVNQKVAGFFMRSFSDRSKVLVKFIYSEKATKFCEICQYTIIFTVKVQSTVKLGNKEHFDKEQICVKEPFLVTNCQFTS